MAEKVGALAGWSWAESPGGITLKLQLAASVEDFRNREFRHAIVSLNDRQLRSLTRDLTRAATKRRLQLYPQPSWWQRIGRAIRILRRG
jgi:hypothetical protein